MSPEEILEKFSDTIEKRFISHCRFHGVDKGDIDYVRCDLIAELYFAAPTLNVPDAKAKAKNYISLIVRNILVDLWRQRYSVTFKKGKEHEISSISEFSEELLANKLAFGEYRDRGSCSHFTEDDSHSPFPGYEDLDEYDQAVIEEFCSQAADNSRRLTLRRRVNSILARQGIETEKIHEYTTRKRSKL